MGSAPGPRTVGARQRVRRPVRGLTVLYDDGCPLCAFVAGWLRRQRQLVPLAPVPVGSDRARTWFPALDHDGAARREVTVVGDGGQVWTGESAWVVCLWALADHRAFSHTLTTPAGRRLARAAVLTAAKWRDQHGRAAAGNGRGRWQHPDAAANRQRHPVASHPPGRGAPRAGRPAGPRGTAPVWVYEGNGGWTQRLPEPAARAKTASGPGAEGAPGPGAGGIPASGEGAPAPGAAAPPVEDTCAGGCSPPG
ncbi:thiol-disulfide oxidoreductase DCC family protein [Actinacidiphila acidipaludis]|uniref:thiol-disulfide oxidoreductase DCC family protein n=1 Tax=Actinacidiphila acidipaludis TaxID=2873382 RepID=UPI0035567C14